MPKLSYAQEVADLEEALAAVRASAEILPPLALTVADELAEQIAEIKALKARQRFYAAERMAVTEALNDGIVRGMVEARHIRACAVLLYGPKSGRLAQFGIRIRRRPLRKTESPAAVEASPLGHGEVASHCRAGRGVDGSRRKGRRRRDWGGGRLEWGRRRWSWGKR